MKRLLLFCLLLPVASRAATYTAASCTRAAVAAAIASEQATPADGDIIAIPSGTCTWTGTQLIAQTFANSVIIQGAGAVSSTTGGASTTGTDVTVIIDNTSASTGSLWAITTTAGKSFRLTAISIQGNGSSVQESNGIVNIGGASTSVRIDHCHFFIPNATSQGLAISGDVEGVADHDYFNSNNDDLTNDIGIRNGLTWLNDSSGIGNASWHDTDHWGSSSFFFVEDSRFFDGDPAEVDDSGRGVFRHNTVTGSSGASTSALQVFWHGQQTGVTRGGRAMEFYDNVFTGNGNNSNAPLSLNSGTTLVWGNTLTGGFQNLIQISYNFRNLAGGGGLYSYPAPPAGWGFCGSAAGGPTNWDGNHSGASGYSCLGQPGRGAGDLLSGSNFASLVNSTTGTVAWPHEALTPIYVWNNSYTPQFYTGSPLIGNNCAGSSVSICTDNTDYYQQYGTLAEPGSNCSVSPCNITVGVNQAARAPVTGTDTCTQGTDPVTSGAAPGVGWWDTANNTLYVCNPTNTWTIYYTPYTYPHPLTGGGNSGTGGSGVSQVCAGFLPYPCARQDLAVQQESSLNLALNNDGTTNYGINFPAGSVYVDPDFGEQVVRVSDGNWTGGACFNSNTQNTLLHNDDNPDLHSISSDDQWFSVVDTNANYFLYKFNPTTLAVTCEPTTASNKQMPWEPIFLHHTAGQMVGPDPVSSGTPWIIQTANVSSLPGLTTSTLVDFSGSTSPNCGAGNATWLTGIPIPTKMFGSSPGMWISNDDSTYELTLGPGQNQDWGSFFYNKTNGECAWVDTRTGQVGGNLVTTGTLSGAFPLDWGSPRAPTAPTATQTTNGSGTLVSGHTYDIAYALSEQTNNDGTGETSASTVQRVTITGGNNAITLPSPQQCSNGANCDNMMWNYFNIYANDEANCSNAQCPASSLFLQPATNLGCSLATPGALTITQHGTAGSTNYTYVEEAWNNNCMTWVSTTTNTGNATLTTSNYNQIAMSTVSGATWYRLIGGGPGNSSAWASTVYGTSSVDAASPSGGGTVLYPAEMYQGSTPNAAFQDTGSEGLAMDSLGTIPICAGLTPGSTWLSGGICSFQNEVTGTVSTSGTAVTGTNFNTQWSSSTVGGMLINGVLYPLMSCASTSACTLGSSAGTQSNVTYHVGIYSGVNNNAVLSAIATSGPTAPTKSTLGMFQHASIMARDGLWHEWGQENTFTSNVLWNLGTLTDVMCNVNKANEYPSAGTYFNCPGHGVMGFSHETLGTGSSNVTSPAAGSDINFNQLCVNLDSSFPANSNGIFLTSHCGSGSGQTFPALDSNGTASYDQHQTWAPSVTYGTDVAAPYQSCWETGQSTPSFQYPDYIGRGFAMECMDFMPDGSFRRYFHHRASGFPYYTTAINCTGNCLQTGLVSYGTETDDGQWALFSSSLDSSCGCDPRQVYSLSSFSAGNPASVTVSATNNGSTNAAPLQGQTVTIVGSSGVAGLNGQWTLGTVSGSAPNYTVVLSGSNLSGTLTGGSLQMCTFDSFGRVNGPVAASTCGVGGNVACKAGSANTSIWLGQKK